MTLLIVLFVTLATVALVAGLERPSHLNLKKVVVDYDTYTFNPAATGPLVNWQITGKYASTGRPYSAFVAIFPTSKFSFYPAVKEGCKELVQPHVSSSTTYDCEYATNGAFFTWDYTQPSLCIGNLISDGTVWQLPTDGSGTNRANMGITKDGKVFFGFPNADLFKKEDFTQLITGWGWLVRNGINNVNASQDLSYSPGGFTLEKAPRTAVGFFKNGTMALLEIDGEEDINYGPDLFETAELMVNLGVVSAINIDGGGSSVSVKNGKVISAPTCKDTPEICERAVANIACVRR
jgi:N-acetylglucosamine-1-phosphodiester alpha-N-acetylglucosaminidase